MSTRKLLLELVSEHGIKQDPINDDDHDQNPCIQPNTDPIDLQCIQYVLSANRADSPLHQTAWEATVTCCLLDASLASEYEIFEIVFDQNVECVRFVIDPMSPVVPEFGKVDCSDEVALDAHPEAVEEGAYCQGSDKDWDGCGYEEGLEFCSENAEVEKGEEAEKVVCSGMKADTPIS